MHSYSNLKELEFGIKLMCLVNEISVFNITKDFLSNEENKFTVIETFD